MRSSNGLLTGLKGSILCPCRGSLIISNNQHLIFTLALMQQRLCTTGLINIGGVSSTAASAPESKLHSQKLSRVLQHVQTPKMDCNTAVKLTRTQHPSPFSRATINFSAATKSGVSVKLPAHFFPAAASADIELHELPQCIPHARSGGLFRTTPVSLLPWLALARVASMIGVVFAQSFYEAHKEETARQAQEHFTHPRTNFQPMTVATAMNILNVPPPIPPPPSSISSSVVHHLSAEQKRIAEDNFIKYMLVTHPPFVQSAFYRSKQRGSSDDASHDVVRNSSSNKQLPNPCIAGKYSAAFRVLIDPKWDEDDVSHEETGKEKDSTEQ